MLQTSSLEITAQNHIKKYKIKLKKLKINKLQS